LSQMRFEAKDEGWQVLLSCVPEGGFINVVVVVDQDVAHAGNLPPRQIGEGFQRSGGTSAERLRP